MNSKLSVVASIAAIAAIAFPFTALSQEKPPIKIGVILPLSGFLKPNGEMYRTGIEMAVEEVNKAGGINGSKISIVLNDDQAAPNESILLFRRHVSEGVVANLGPISGTSWESVAPLANAMKTPALNFTALKPGISKKPYAMRIHPNDSMMVPEGVTQFIQKFPNVSRVVVAGDAKEASGASGLQEFQNAAKAKSLNVLDVVSFETRATDYSPVAIKIKSLAPDAVFLSSFGPNALALLKELDLQGVKVPILVNALIWAGSFPQTATAGADRIYTVGFKTNEPIPAMPRYAEFVKQYVARAEATTSLPKPINVANASIAYDAVMLLADIIKAKAIDGSTDVTKARQVITEGLGGVKTWSGFNSITMNDEGDGYIPSKLIELDLAAKAWKFSTVK
jgi:branched-chain amino acid transport system substrate-binding protein